MNGIRFILFTASLFFFIFFQVCNFWWLLALFIAIIAGFTVMLILRPRARDILGWMGLQIGVSKDFRFYTLVALTLLFFLFGFKYGTGEPLFVDAWRDTVKMTRKHYSPEQQKSVNSLLFGLHKEDSKIEKEIAYLKSIGVYDGDNIRPKDRMTETEEEYNQKIRNWTVYKLFVADTEMKSWLKDMPTDQKLPEEKKESRRTWIFWKLFLVFGLLSLFYLPFWLSDKVEEALRSYLDDFRTKRGEIKSKIAAGDLAGAESLMGRLGLLYTSDMLGEFTIKALEGLIKLFQRNI